MSIDAIMDEYAHRPVLLHESVALLLTEDSGAYVDGTLGGGGHTREILNRLGIAGKVIGFDADARAIEECSQRFRGEIGKRLVLVNRNFSELGEWLADQNIGEVNGILLDLGVSSFQFDAEVGFSYRSDSPLDMRFRRDRGTGAKEIVNEYSAEELVRIFREYGEEPKSKVIANAIVKRRSGAAIETTFQLRDAVASVVPQRFLVKHLSRVFQALRIVVNDELGSLEKVLKDGVGIVKQGGRIVVISYHSLEDRIVKNFFRYESLTCICPPHTPVCTCGKIARLKIITRKPMIPGENEIRMNPRARSAKLRAAQKIV